MKLAAVLALFLSGCGATVRPGCESVSEPIDDEESTVLGFSAADVLATVVGDHAVTARRADDTTVEATVGFERGEGQAQLVRSTPTTIRTPNGQLFGDHVLLIAVTCGDGLSIPGRIQVDTIDGSVAVDETGNIAAGAADEPQMHIETEAADLEGVPAAEGREPDGGFVVARFFGGELLSGGVGWTGTDEDEDSVSRWSKDVLSWGD